ncbi:hypothetical protein K1719_001715 [Acacia pycnantha]|nr:hypothetical protein K1719_001715 [Acacia pycnantha]
MEKLTDHTSNPGYLVEYTKRMAQQDSFMKQVFDDEVAPSTVILKGVGEVEVGHLRKFRHVLQNAFDLKMKMESPSVARKRAELNQSVQVLRESKEVLANIIDTISSQGY